MKALTWHGKNDIRCETVPDPKIQDGRDAIIKVTACAICGSDLHLFDGVMPIDGKGRCAWSRDHGRSRRGRSREQEAQGWRSGGGAVHDLLRRMLFLQEGLLLRLRAVQPEPQDGREAVGTFAGRSVWLLAHAGRVLRRPGRIPARSLCRRRSHQGAARPQRRTGSVPFRHLPDRFHGRRLLQSQRRRDGCRVGLRSGRTVRHQECVSVGRRTRHCDRHRARAAGSGGSIGCD